MNIHYLFLQIAGVIFIIFGTIGNVFVIALEINNGIGTSASVYLVALAASDLANIYTGLLRLCVFGFTETDIPAQSTVLCRYYIWLQYSFQFCSSWILVAFNLERCFLVVRPLTSKLTPRTAVVVCLWVTAICLVIGVPKMLTFDVAFDENLKIKRCKMIESTTADIRQQLFPWLNLLLDCVLPFLFFVAAHLLIIRRTNRRNSEDSQKTTSSQPASPDQFPIVTSQADSRDNTPQATAVATTSRVHSSKKAQSVRQVTRMILLTDIAFFVFTAPRAIYILIFALWTRHLVAVLGKDLTWFLFVDLSMIGFINNVLNIAYYCAVSSQYRQRLVSMLQVFRLFNKTRPN